MLKIDSLVKTFDDGTKALRNISLEVERGEFIVILGPSGSGKTTLMRSINGLIESNSGSIYLDGQRVSKENLRGIRAKVGMIFQDFNLVDNLSAMNNVLTGLLNKQGTLASIFYIFKKERKLQALDCLAQVGLLSKAYARADQLSGGQQQRVGIARAIVKQPVLLLADEPVSNLDPMIAYEILSVLKDINVSRKITVICNLHQVDFALRFASRIVGLASGRIVMDEAVENLDEAYIQNIYRGHEQGMFFGPTIDHAHPDEDIRFSV